MIRWLRAAVGIAAVLAVLAMGLAIGLLAVANGGYVAIQPHEWLRPVLDPLLGGRVLEIQVPVLLAGWLVAGLAVLALVVGTMRFAFRRRQHESLIGRLERELVRLRNLPITAPAPLEDLPEQPDAEAARALERAMRQRLGAAGDVLAGELPAAGLAAPQRAEGDA